MGHFARLVCLALAAAAVDAFVPHTSHARGLAMLGRVHASHRARVLSEMMMSEAVEDAAAAPSEEEPAAAAEAGEDDGAAPLWEPPPPASAKEELLGAIGGVGPAGSPVGDELRATVVELLLKLETANPTDEPATSPLLNGVWDLVYSGNYAPGPLAWSPTRQLALFLYAGGYTPGLFALNVARSLPGGLLDTGALSLTINRGQPRVEASSTLALSGGASQSVVVRATLEAESAVRLRETHTELEAFGRKFDLPAALQYTRQLYVTYVDEELLVVKDESGIADILLRKAFNDFGLDEGVPSVADDDLAPGAG